VKTVLISNVYVISAFLYLKSLKLIRIYYLSSIGGLTMNYQYGTSILCYNNPYYSYKPRTASSGRAILELSISLINSLIGEGDIRSYELVY